MDVTGKNAGNVTGILFNDIEECLAVSHKTVMFKGVKSRGHVQYNKVMPCFINHLIKGVNLVQFEAVQVIILRWLLRKLNKIRIYFFIVTVKENKSLAARIKIEVQRAEQLREDLPAAVTAVVIAYGKNDRYVEVLNEGKRF